MVPRNRFIFLLTFLTTDSLALQLEVGLMKELLSFPLKGNPFFAKVVALASNFNTDGITEESSDTSGFSCQMLGDFKCQDQFPSCSGMGYIDCTTDCPGTEEEFKFFNSMMEDDKIKESFPLISAKMMKNKKKDESNKEMAEEKDAMADDPKKLFLMSLQTCTNFSESTRALLSLAGGEGGGMQFGANSDDPSDLTYVSPNAVSNISMIEYDYSDYYDDSEEEAESSKIRRDANEESLGMEVTKAGIDRDRETINENIRDNEAQTNKDGIQKYEKIKDCKFKKCQKDTSLAKKKQDYMEKTNGMEDYKELSEDDRKTLNMIRSVEDDQELSETNLTAREENKTSERVTREIIGLRRLFHSSLDLMRSGQLRSKRSSDSLVVRVARRMDALRQRREIEMTEKMTDKMADYCIVRNMTCLEFPTRAKCSGFGVGRCGTMRDMLVKLFTPHVVMVSVVSIIVIVMVTVGLSYYCYKLKSENRVEPSEQDEPERPNGVTVKNVASAPSSDNE